jgi:nitroreductase
MLPRRAMLLGGIAAAAAVGAAATFWRMGTMAEYAAAVAAMRSVPQHMPQTHDLIRAATLAANSHNTQPWRFRPTLGGIDILPDTTRRLAAVDPDDHHLFASLGCAAENLLIAAGASGPQGALRFATPQADAVSLVFAQTEIGERELYDAIPKRQSTRGDYDGRAVPSEHLAKLAAAAAAIPGVDLVLVTERSRIDRIRDLVLAGNSVQLADAAFRRELESWLRFNPHQALAAGDGLFSAASGNPTLPSWLAPLVFDMVFTAKGENAKYARQIASSAGLAVFLGAQDNREHWVAAGRACQRFALQATALGLKHAFLNQPVEVASLRPELARLAGFPGRRPDIVMRFGYGPALPFSPRRPVAAVLARGEDLDNPADFTSARLRYVRAAA